MSFYFEEKPFEKYGKELIKHVNIKVEPGEHIAVIGENGIGKTTLLRSIFNKYEETAYLMEQDLSQFQEFTALDYIMSWYPKLFELKRKITTDYEYISDYIEHNGYEIEERIIRVAKQFALSEEDLDKTLSVLSGGQQTKVALVRAMISQRSLILLDEPTNHLDHEMIDEVVKYINRSNSSLLFVSHHRGFIDLTASHIIEVSPDSTRKFVGNYSQYQSIIDVERQTEARAYEKKQKEIKALESTIQRVQDWHHSAKQSASVRNPLEQKRLSKLAQKAKVKESQLNQKIDKLNTQKPNEDNRHFHFVNQHSVNKKFLVTMKDVSVTINNQIIFNEMNFEIKHNENILLTGPNGSGKSLLIALISQQFAPDEGDVYVTPSLKIAYFDQKNANLDYQSTPLSMLLDMDGMARSQAQTILASFGFDQRKITQPISNLSIGEKSRLQFVLLYFSNPHLLILDEPTNYFDIATQDLILKMLDSFTGQVLIVTHDDYLKSQFEATHWSIENNKLVNVSLTPQEESNVDDTLKLLEDYNSIDEDGHFQTDD
ncbi:Sal family ABC-F type ribosomal protection protein [Staphylococcus sp. Marseille-Q5304]|uniref:Sal family ABC-F type ribosomal protection protein n=1 Tax=Staphylococcus sp. Marseille-Q5304 TaxID=2942200 RepID=UPI0020745E20|nr:Sal family ABC-F type ribosomal protection protein [Staphylococcus sp. Marseille-Q5304]